MSKSIKKNTAKSSEEPNAKSLLRSPTVKKEVLSSNGPDLSNFKFIKKPHIKIEYDDNSSNKGEQKGIWEPQNWRDFLLNLQTMRSNNDAPVDSMGCHMSMDENAPPQVYRYQCLVSLMLSSQTKDQVTFAAMERLRARGLTIDNILQMSDEELGKLIYPVGFWKTKVKYIKKTTQTLKDQYNSDIPDSVDKLCKLTGVGPKMAHICMKVAWNKVTGIGVDTHVHRISNRIGWVKTPTNIPEDTRKALQTWIPFELWSEVNHLMVGFGQTICLPVNPNCNECLNNDICPSSNKNKKSPNKSAIKEDKPSVNIKNKKSPSPAKQKKFDEESDQKFESKELKIKIDLKNESSEDLTKESHSLEFLPYSKTIKPLKRKTALKKELKSEAILDVPDNDSQNKIVIEKKDENKHEKYKKLDVQQRVTRSKTQNNIEINKISKGKKSP